MLTYRPLRRDELRLSLRLVLQDGEGRYPPGEEQIDAFLAYAASSHLDVERQWGAFRDGCLVSTCLLLVSPGRSAVLFLPRFSDETTHGETVVQLLRHVVADAAQRDIRLLQTMVEPGDAASEIIVSAAGFRHLAELIYMQRDASWLFRQPASPPDLGWTTYDPGRHALFAETVLATYEASLDCPGLAGLRTIDDTLATHRAAGEHDPRWWFVVTVRGEPAGTLLLTRIRGRSAIEVVYMGLAPRFRGQGIAFAMMHRAVRIARDASCPFVTLAVDRANVPALHLYRRCQFHETSRRHAWIIAPGR